jgi:hypothetical protein
MTDLAEPLTTDSRSTRLGVARTLSAGFFGGLVLGIIARAWMRLIAEDPAFSWNGTIFIVSGFAIFGLTQAIAAATRSRARRRWTLTIARVVGVIGLLPLFIGAGGLMLPTVVGGGLAYARVHWPNVIRGILLLVASLPVVLVAHDLVGSFGWSLHSLAGFVTLLAVYGTIIWATQFTFAAQADGWRMPRWLTAALFTALGLLFAFLTAGFIFT